MGVRFFILFLVFAVFSPPLARAAEPMVVALNVALTGIANEGDRGIVIGAKLAVQKINTEGGVLGRPLELLIVDNQGTDIGARNAAVHIASTRAMAMIGAGRSSRSLVAAEVAQRRNMLMLTPFSTHPDITKLGDYIFRVGFNDEFQGKALGELAATHLKAKRAIILENVSEEYSSILANHFTENFERNGGSVVWRGHYRRVTIDFSEILKKVQNQTVDLIFVPGYTKRSAWLIRQARQMGIQTTFLGGDGWGVSMYEYGGDDIDGQFSTDHWHRDVDTPASHEFVRFYQQERGDIPIISTGVPLTFDAVYLVAEAMKISGAASRQAVRDGLRAIRKYKAVTGSITFDAFGDPKDKDMIFTRFENHTKRLVRVFQCCATLEKHP